MKYWLVNSKEEGKEISTICNYQLFDSVLSFFGTLVTEVEQDDNFHHLNSLCLHRQ